MSITNVSALRAARELADAVNSAEWRAGRVSDEEWARRRRLIERRYFAEAWRLVDAATAGVTIDAHASGIGA